MKKLEKIAQIVSKIKSFLNKYNLEGINYLSEKNEWKKFEKNTLATALNDLIFQKTAYPYFKK